MKNKRAEVELRDEKIQLELELQKLENMEAVDDQKVSMQKEKIKKALQEVEKQLE